MLTRYTSLKRTPFKRKPPKTQTRIVAQREICAGAAWEERRKEAHDRAVGLCEAYRPHGRCCNAAPLHNGYDEYGEQVPAGHAHHKNGTRGLGGGKRDDSLANLQWTCAGCHEQAHRPKKAVPAKLRDSL